MDRIYVNERKSRLKKDKKVVISLLSHNALIWCRLAFPILQLVSGIYTLCNALTPSDVVEAV